MVNTLKRGILRKIFGKNHADIDNQDKEASRDVHVIHKEEFVLDTHYKPVKRLGEGAYGAVISVKDLRSDKMYAVKKNMNVFQTKPIAQRILREMRILGTLDHPNIIKLVDIIDPVSVDDFNSIYLVLDYMQSDLHRIIQSKNVLSDAHVSFIVYQILCGLKHMHTAGIYHRDLKPSNVLIDRDCNVKICDFGLARGVNAEQAEQADLTEYVVTRWYRAPEVVLDVSKYSDKVDMWSVGCILAEMYYRKPLFKGEDYLDQLMRIFTVIGRPSKSDLKECIKSERGYKFIDNMVDYPAQDWRDIIPHASDEAIDLISKLLTFNTNQRLNVDEALMHPFFSDHFNQDFVNSSKSAEIYDDKFQSLLKNDAQIRRAMMSEIIKFRPDSIFPENVDPSPQVRQRPYRMKIPVRHLSAQA
jgi:mitogen-activated protein kinase 1/3